MLRVLLPKMVNAPIHFGCCNYTTVQTENNRTSEVPPWTFTKVKDLQPQT